MEITLLIYSVSFVAPLTLTQPFEPGFAEEEQSNQTSLNSIFEQFDQDCNEAHLTAYEFKQTPDHVS